MYAVFGFVAHRIVRKFGTQWSEARLVKSPLVNLMQKGQHRSHCSDSTSNKISAD